MQNRREFIKQSCSLCAGIAGLGIPTTQLTGCAPMPIFKAEIKKNSVQVPLSSFIESNNMITVSINQMEFNILLIKKFDGNFAALEMKCSHQANPLTAGKTGLYCSTHGSAFDLEGNVTKEPALLPLKIYKTELNNSSVEIFL